MAEYISREAALESLCIACEYVPIDEKENCRYRFTGCQEYANIFSIPAADVRPAVRGKWIAVEGGEPGDRKCNICGCFHHAWEAHGYYCQHCGARMEESE